MANKTKCTYCGNKINNIPNLFNKKPFCNKSCLKNHLYFNEDEDGKCDHCGDKIGNSAKVSWEQSKVFCCGDCSYRYHQEMKMQERECEYCESTFKVDERSKKRVCSSACGGRLSAKERRTEVECNYKHCDNTVETSIKDSEQGSPVYCNDNPDPVMNTPSCEELENSNRVPLECEEEGCNRVVFPKDISHTSSEFDVRPVKTKFVQEDPREGKKQRIFICGKHRDQFIARHTDMSPTEVATR